MALLFADENYPFPVVDVLRTLGHDVTTTQETGLQGKDDEFLLLNSSGQRRAILTFNRRHFFKLHKKHPDHGGIIACTEDDDRTALAHRVHQAITAISTLEKQLVRIYRPALKKKP